MKPRIAILCLPILISACDLHKEERYAEQKNLESISIEAERMRGQLDDVDRSIAKLEIEVKEAREDHKANDTEYEKNKLELAKYSMDHKLAATAAAAGAAGVAALFSDLDQDQKAAIAAPTVLAVGYCLLNGDECTEVSTRIAYYGTQIAFFKGKATEAQQRELGARAQMSSQDVNRQTIKAKLAEVNAKVATLRETIRSLECRLPICL